MSGVTSRRLELLSTRWPDEFRQPRRFGEDANCYVKVKRNLDADTAGVVNLLLRDSEEIIPDRGIEAVETFCHGASLHDLINGRNGAHQKRAAWLDDRTGHQEDGQSSLNLRQNNQTLTATELYRALLKPVRTLNYELVDGTFLTQMIAQWLRE